LWGSGPSSIDQPLLEIDVLFENYSLFGGKRQTITPDYAATGWRKAFEYEAECARTRMCAELGIVSMI
jgi:hypothetical protein